MTITQWSTTPATNGSGVTGINAAEGCPPSVINDDIRQAMADVAEWFGQKYQHTALTSVAGTNTITATGPAALAAYAANQLWTLTPAATNTGATTLNITPSGGAALTAKNVFSGGAACVGGELVIGVPAMVMYDGTQFNIVGSPLNSSYTGTLTGCTTAPTIAISYQVLGGWVRLDMVNGFSATSNATTKTITGMPSGIRPSGSKFTTGYVSDNGGATVLGKVVLDSSGVLTFSADTAGAAWTNSGTATIQPMWLTYKL